MKLEPWNSSQKARGAKKSLQAAHEELIKAGYAGGRIVMAHRSNDKFCQLSSQSSYVKNFHKLKSRLSQPLDSAVLCRRGWTPHGI